MTLSVANKLTIPFVNFKSRYARYREEILQAVDSVFSSGNYILGQEVDQLEKELSVYLDCPYVLGVNDGTTALILSLKVLNIGVGDEVIVPVNSFVASAGAVAAVGATPVFCDVCEDLNIDVDQIEKLITKKTKAIMPVHLTGRPAKMQIILDIAKKYQLSVVEDAAQSIGAKYHGKYTGTLGELGCFSLHPLKNLHAYGDAGIITTKNKIWYEELKLLRNHGLINRDRCVKWGMNARIDTVQAAIILHGLKYLNEWNSRRRHIALCYQNALKNNVVVPIDAEDEFCVYHNFVILTRKRDALSDFLKLRGIDTRVHYPIPLHLQPAAKSLGYKLGDFPVAEQLAKEMLSLPVYPELSDNLMDYIIGNTVEFFDGN